ncbi:two-component system response regulator YesN [Planomicrobium sp. HSC-17F08]|nr:two-component system response regulator YesN [Planomicrobium sp. HSC-17F08]
MHRLLIVDDEWMIREGLEKTVPWEDWNIEVAGTAQNGLEAIDKLQKEPVDILLTDIRMPGMNGLELTEHCREHYPTLKIVLLTGHNEFSYAQQALRLGASDFLLKPTDITELEKTIRALTANLEQEKSEQNHLLTILIGNAIENPTGDNLAKLKSFNSLPPSYGLILVHRKEGAPSTFEWDNSIQIKATERESVYLFSGIKDEAHWDGILNEINEQVVSQRSHGIMKASSIAAELEQVHTLYTQAYAASVPIYKDAQVSFCRYQDESHHNKLQEMLNYITLNLDQPINQSEIAKKLHMSNSNFSKVFKQYTGMNFVDLITERRIEKAKELLSSTQLKTYEIAQLTGFSESRYFSQLFKKKTGCTPKEYREKAGK